jgi:hypothetical protein
MFPISGRSFAGSASGSEEFALGKYSIVDNLIIGKYRYRLWFMVSDETWSHRKAV